MPKKAVTQQRPRLIEGVPPAVTRFEAAKREIERLREENEDLFDMLEGAIEEYNAALEQANAVVRALETSCGDFKVTSAYTEYDPDALFELVGREKFLELGGTEDVRRSLTVDKVKLRSYIEAGKVPKHVAEAISTPHRKYSTPKPLKLV